jgi:hypothetical protein
LSVGRSHGWEPKRIWNTAGNCFLSWRNSYINLIGQDLSRKTLKEYIDNVWVLGGTIIKDVSILNEHKEGPLKRILEAVEYGGCLPEHSAGMNEWELAFFERMCGKFEKFQRSQEPLSAKNPRSPRKKRGDCPK